MPHPTGTYADTIAPEFAPRLLRDATAQADADLVFRSYHFVYVLEVRRPLTSRTWHVRVTRKR
jgi:hypothetical protein